MGFLALSFDLGALESDAAEAACFEVGALSVTLTDGGDDPVLEPMPGEVRLWPATRAQALFSDDAEPESLIAALASALGLAPRSIEARAVADRAWALEWRERFHAMRFGRRLWVAPSHETVTEPDAAIVRLDPGLAFGTGTHPTTAMCLRWIDAHLRAGAQVIDYGCGSGILAVAAAVLGAARIECFDIDPQALIATASNAMQNGVADRVITLASADALTSGTDVLLANILAGPLVALATQLAALVRTGGSLVLAGLLERDAAEVTAAYRPWFDMRRFEACEDWVGLAGSKVSRVA